MSAHGVTMLGIETSQWPPSAMLEPELPSHDFPILVMINLAYMFAITLRVLSSTEYFTWMFSLAILYINAYTRPVTQIYIFSVFHFSLNIGHIRVQLHLAFCP